MGERSSLGLEERVALLEAQVRRLDRALASGNPRTVAGRAVGRISVSVVHTTAYDTVAVSTIGVEVVD